MGIREKIITGSAILVGLTLAVSGIAKIPGQVEFANVLLKSFWPAQLAYLIAYSIPWIEAGLGILLLIGVLSRVVAACCIPLTLGFLANNIWALHVGFEKFPVCGDCFGVLQEYTGSLSPLGALIYGIVLLTLPLVVLLLSKEGFLNIKPWFARRKKLEG
jgi:uncharacterized membrane protein YphA (DoxX/SURF4 family)